ncbi:MAG: hypothetical protein K2L67_05310 [Clostridia bacterium]|nr:hypothetical protein [Clostridia bacterium]
MKKNLKLLVIGLLVAVAATLTCAFMPACGDGATTYSVKVTCADDIDFTQIQPQWCVKKADGTMGGCSLPTMRLNANGEASYTPAKALGAGESFHVSLLKLPDGYDYENKEIYVTAYGTVTIALIKTN